MRFKLSLLLIALVVALVAASPDLQSFTPIRNLRVTGVTQLMGVTTIDGAATFNGDVTMADDLALTGAVDIDGATTVDALTVAEGATLQSDLSVAGDTTLSGFLLIPRQDIVLAAGGIITPTASMVVLTSAAEVTTSTSIPIWTAGIITDTVIILRNDNAADPINIDGTGGTVECKADVALGASDTLTLVYNGVAWNCVAGYDNS